MNKAKNSVLLTYYNTLNIAYYMTVQLKPLPSIVATGG